MTDRRHNPPFNPRIDGYWPPTNRQKDELARLEQDFEAMNAPQMRRDRLETLARRMLPFAWALSILLIATLLLVIFGHAIARAADTAALAPLMMRH